MIEKPKVGDEVTIFNTNTVYDNLTGVIISILPEGYLIKINQTNVKVLLEPARKCFLTEKLIPLNMKFVPIENTDFLIKGKIYEIKEGRFVAEDKTIYPLNNKLYSEEELKEYFASIEKKTRDVPHYSNDGVEYVKITEDQVYDDPFDEKKVLMSFTMDDRFLVKVIKKNPLNMKFVPLKTTSDLTKGKTYEIKDGKFFDDCGRLFPLDRKLCSETELKEYFSPINERIDDTLSYFSCKGVEYIRIVE